MRTTSKIAIGVLIVGIILLGIGYATINNITLNIGGTITADPSDANFKVRFTGTPEVSDVNKVTAGITDDLNTIIDVKGLTTVGETVTATYAIENASENLSADLAITTTNSNEEYFEIQSALAKTSLIAKETTTVTVTIKLIKTLITESESATINVALTAAPVQPGEETTGGSDTSEEIVTSLASVTNENIGDYIDLGNDIVDYKEDQVAEIDETTGMTTDDWRIFYVDEENDIVYAILSSYLPNSTGYAKNTGLVTTVLEEELVYGVSSTTSGEDLVVRLTDETAWNGLANGISGATVTGTPTADLLMKSYNEENGTSLNYTDSPNLIDNCNTGAYSLYLPHTTKVDSCGGIWLASAYEDSSNYVWNVNCTGKMENAFRSENIYGVRPVVALPSNIQATKLNEIWTVTK